MTLALIPPSFEHAAAIASTLAHGTEAVWWLAREGAIRPELLATQSCHVITKQADPSHLATSLLSHLGTTNDLVLPDGVLGRELAAALSIGLGIPVVGPLLWLEPTKAVLLHGDACHEVPRPERAVYVVAAKADVPPLVPVETWTERVLESDNGTSPPPLRSLAIHPPDPEALDLAEARRIFAAGIGCETVGTVSELGAIATSCGASLGATRVVTDAGWLPFERQIGTTGVIVDPDLYVAFGISGAVQHLTGIGRPNHIVAVNTDASTPMMKFADLAIQADAPETVRALSIMLNTGDTPS